MLHSVQDARRFGISIQKYKKIYSRLMIELATKNIKYK